MLSNSSLFAQTWEQTWGESQYDAASEMKQTSDGGFIVVGSHTNPFDSIFGDILLLKLDAIGEEEWHQVFATEKSDGATSVLITSDGGYLIAGWSRGLSANGSLDNWFIKTDHQGNLEWENKFVNGDEDDWTTKLIPANDGGYIAFGTTANVEPTWYKAKIIKMDENGNILWDKLYWAPNWHYFGTDIIALNDGSGYVFSGDSDYKANLTKVDNSGNVLFDYGYTFPGDDHTRGYCVAETDDGGFLLGADEYYANTGNENRAFIVKTDTNGIEEWSNIYGGQKDERLGKVIKSANGNFCFLGTSNSVGNNYIQLWLFEIDENGNVIWERYYGGIQRELYGKLNLDSNNGFLIAAATASYGAGNLDAYLLRTDSLGHVYSNYVQGNVFEDINENCIKDGSESVLSKWLVRIAGDRIYETLTDDDGNYKQNVEPGDYIVTIHPPNNYWETNCIDSTEVSFTQPYEFLELDIPIRERVDCAFLEVDIATAIVRICSQPKYYVNYCNTGSATSSDAYIEILMDEYITIDSASIPIASQVDDLYTFNIGSIEQSDCGNFELYTTVDCDTTILGYTHCVEANIYPDSLCLHPDSLIWGGASLMLSGECQSDSIYFFIQNVGDATTTSARQYIVIEDDVMYDVGDVILDPNEIRQIAVPANGSTFRLEAEQEEGHPGNSMPSIVIQGCGQSIQGDVSNGFVNIFAFNEGDATTSIMCNENVYPFDPNDKQGFPNGYRDAHFIEKGQSLEYLIRFQNTGNAEAYVVSIVDTISTHLDVASIRPGVASHAYEYEVLGNQVIRFTFNDINLPDSTTNFDASQGFVQFKIDQKETTDIGDVIYNSANIYFDFASPVKTNETWHTIGEDFIEVIVKNEEVFIPELSVNAFPNPFQESTTMQLENTPADQYIFTLYNPSGQLLRGQSFDNKTLQFERRDLSRGIYFYQIHSSDKLIATGKLIVQ